MSDEDDFLQESGLFREKMSGVTPLKRGVDGGRRDRREPRDDPSLELRRRAAVQGPAEDRNTLTDSAIAPLDPWYVLSFKRPGIQDGVFRKLRQGRYEAQARLDLHRMSMAVARRETFDFIEDAYRLGLRSVMIIHGKGGARAPSEQNSLLKGCVNHWLRELEPVQAFHSAQPQHGGTGAVYVLLRKSEAAKQETRQQFSRGRDPIDRND